MRYSSMFIIASALLLLSTAANATYLSVIGPVSANLTQNQSVYLGKVGPGQSFYVLANATTTNSSGTKVINIGWDRLYASGLPQGWSMQASPLYENPMKMKVTVSPNAPYGQYKLTLQAENVGNYSKLGNLTFYAYVNVTPDVFKLNVNPTYISTGTGQPANLYINISNTGISDDPFIINAYGLPAWNVSYQVISLHGTSKTFIYPVFIDEPGSYNFNLTVSSSSSGLISQSYGITLVSQASLLNDYSAIGQGVVLSPIIYGPVYSVMLLIDYVYSSIFG